MSGCYLLSTFSPFAKYWTSGKPAFTLQDGIMIHMVNKSDTVLTGGREGEKVGENNEF